MLFNIKRNKYSFLARIIAVAMMWYIGTDCIAISNIHEPELSWKNLSVLGKRMSVYCIFTDHRGIVWLGTNNGLFFYDGVTTHAVNEMANMRNIVYTIIEHDDRLLLGTNKGLITFSFQTNKFVYCTPEGSVREIRCMQLIDDELWMGSIYGMYTYNMQTHKLRDMSEGLPHKSVYSMLRDSRGILYAGTYDGLARWNATGETFREVEIQRQGQSSNNLFVNCLLETADQQHIYIGTEGHLYRYLPITGACSVVEQVNGNNIKCLAQSKDGNLLVGTNSGIFHLQNNSIRQYIHDSRQEQTLANNEIWCLYSDRANHIWAGHEVGFSLASNSNAIRVIRLSTLTRSGEGNDVHSIYRDKKGVLWINGTNGAIRLADRGNVKWYRSSGHPHSLSHNHIRAIKEDNDGTIWFATDGGLNRYNTEADNFDVFHIVDKAGKHVSNWVYALEEDGDYFWVGSYLGGLHYVSKSKFESSSGGVIIADQSVNVSSSRFKHADIRLNNNLINKVVKDHSGNLWIACFDDSILTKITADGLVEKYDIGKIAGGIPNLLTLDVQGRLWCAFKGGVLVFSHGDSCRVVKFPQTGDDESVLAMERVEDDVWVSTVSNVWNIDGKSLEVTLLPIPQKSYKSIFSDSITGKVYLGGNDEITEVDPLRIDEETDRTAVKMILADTGSGVFDLSRLTPQEKGLVVPNGKNLTLIVSNLNYAPDAPQRYFYKLTKSHTDTIGKWIIMPEDFNTISLPELNMGNYFILLKTVSPLGAVYTLPIHVQVPWSLSWWAFCSYFLLILIVITCVIFYMHKRNMRMIQEEDRRKSLENAERKLTFLSTISHDLKTPLSMIMGPISVLKEKVGDKEILKSLEGIYENAVKLNTMIHRTLEVNRLDDEERNGLIISTFDVVDFCKNIFDAFKESHPQKQFVFYSSLPQLIIDADIVKFESIITNLLSNACKYSEAGSTISCGISCVEHDVNIIVSDNGVGIAKIDQPLVFQRMFRAPATSKTHEGTGLGLYLAKKYIEMMDGSIELYSEKGQGTSFVVTLPLSEKPMAETDSNVSIENTDATKPKILIVEDNRQISGFIADLLKKDYVCLSAENGRAGLSIAASFIPDLIISDELMPVMKGTEMIGHLKQNARLANIPIIMLTAKDDYRTEGEGIKLGVDVFMSKPFEPAVLSGRIKHLLELRAKLQESIRIRAITEVKPIEAESVSEKQLAKISKVIEDNISDPDLNVNFVCEKCGIPNKQLYRIIKKHMGIGPLDYIRNVRLQKAAMLLSQKRFTVSEVCYMVGFKTPSYFAKCFLEKFGVKPSQYESDDKSVI